MFAVRRREVNAKERMKMVWHNHEVEQFEFWIFRRQRPPVFLDGTPQGIQDDVIADNRPEDRLVLRHLNRHRPPARPVIDIPVPQ